MKDGSLIFEFKKTDIHWTPIKERISIGKDIGTRLSVWKATVRKTNDKTK